MRTVTTRFIVKGRYTFETTEITIRGRKTTGRTRIMLLTLLRGNHPDRRKILGWLSLSLAIIVYTFLTLRDEIKPRSIGTGQLLVHHKTVEAKTETKRGSLPSHDITVVTAYFDLGTFRKGYQRKYCTKKMYMQWAETFKFMENPLVVYTDSAEFHILMTSLRQGKENSTFIFPISRNSSWAFQNEPEIKHIISTPEYPKHYPNTVISGYSCSQHAKYDVIERAARANYFNTKFMAWLDVGYFRERNSTNKFKLLLLKDFEESRVAMNEIVKRRMNRRVRDIFLNNKVWLGGGLFFGEMSRLIVFAKQFKKSVAYFLSRRLVNTDQQVVYAMYSEEGRKSLKPDVELHVYHFSGWFSLGKAMLCEL